MNLFLCYVNNSSHLLILFWFFDLIKITDAKKKKKKKKNKKGGQMNPIQRLKWTTVFWKRFLYLEILCNLHFLFKSKSIFNNGRWFTGSLTLTSSRSFTNFQSTTDGFKNYFINVVNRFFFSANMQWIKEP